MATKSDQAVSDQKKRTLDALEQRFAVAKAEVLRQEQKNKKQLDQGNKDGNGHPMDFSYPTTSARENEASGLPSSMPSSKRGRFAFSGSRGISKISEIENGATYSLILQPIDEKLLNADVKFLSGRGSVVDNVLHDLLQKGDSAQKYMKGSKSTSIDNWILLDNFVQRRNASAGARIKALQSQSKRSTRHMSMKQHRKCGSLDFPREYPKISPSFFMNFRGIPQDGQSRLSSSSFSLKVAVIIGLTQACEEVEDFWRWREGRIAFLAQVASNWSGRSIQGEDLMVLAKHLLILVVQGKSCVYLPLTHENTTTKSFVEVIKIGVAGRSRL
ncbi:hypothetical protein GIB67_002133 [Kingdonia uniflora]|uniref:Uncharacterized protein n=1 Tax=Kingdonia uniflora TaxID=39325 RepID=A0A7J7KWP3_9MAGN|nr:hypothetical protein GIB67_002133 [Kingdonia uniflora]